MYRGVTFPAMQQVGLDGRSAGWVEEIPESRRKPLRHWLWSIAAMTFGVLVVGGITRLTLSGLSIVDWQPVRGVIPPLTDAQWQEAFEKYQQFPEYLTWRQSMTLSEFRSIYFWEYLHRLMARSIGIVFMVPFLVFLIRGWFTRPLLKRALILFGLGAGQGLLGWLMVRSGLVDRPSVSHFRLAAHLTLAFVIFGWAVWLARDLSLGPSAKISTTSRSLMIKGLTITGVLLALQVIWGAFVAGLKAGRYYPTFPLMGGQLTPPDLLHLEPVLSNFVANPSAVQWVHRVLGTLFSLAVVALALRVRKGVADPMSRRNAVTFAGLVGAQYGLGIATLVLLVPVSLGVIHQAMAMVIFGVWLGWLHHVVRAEEVKA